MSIKPTSVPTKILSQNLASDGAVLYLSDLLGWDRVQLTSAAFGTQLFGVLRNADNSQLEIMELDPATVSAASAITILKRGLSYDGGQVALAKPAHDWNAFETYVELGSDAPQVLAQMVEQSTDETVSGIKTFLVPPKSPSVPVAPEDLTNKVYVDAGLLQGSPNASDTTRGVTKLSAAPADPSNPVALGQNDPLVPSSGQKDAMAGGGAFGTPSSSNKFITEAHEASSSGLPVVHAYANSGSPHTWTKPAGLKYVIVEVQGAGGGSGGTDNDSGGNVGTGGGGAGGYSRKVIAAASLGATETATVGAGGTLGAAGGTPTAGGTGGTSSFGSHCSATGGGGTLSADTSASDGGAGGSGSSGDVNIAGGGGGAGFRPSSGDGIGGAGGSSPLGGGGPGQYDDGVGAAGGNYGGGAGGAAGAGRNGAAGAQGVVIVTEYFK